MFSHTFENSCEVIIKYNGDIEDIKQDLGLIIEDLNKNYCIVTIEKENLKHLRKNKNIKKMELAQRIISFSDSDRTLENDYVGTLKLNNYSGKGILMGIIEPHINIGKTLYFNQDGSSKILSIWNERDRKELKKRELAGLFSRINKNIRFEEEENKREYEFVIANIGKSYKDNFITTTEFMRGIHYLVEKSKAMNKPMVISTTFDILNILGLNYSLFHEYLEETIKDGKLAIVAPRDRLKEKLLYAQERIENNKKAYSEFMIGEDQRTAIIEIYKNKLDDINIELINPSGNSIGKIKNNVDFSTVDTPNEEIHTIYFESSHSSKYQRIVIILMSKDDSLAKGKWRMKYHDEKITDGNIYLSLIVDEFVQENIYFLDKDSIDKSLKTINFTSSIIDTDNINRLMQKYNSHLELSPAEVAYLSALIMEKEIFEERKNSRYGENVKRYFSKTIKKREKERRIMKNHSKKKLKIAASGRV